MHARRRRCGIANATALLCVVAAGSLAARAAAADADVEAARPTSTSRARVAELVRAGDYEPLRALGPPVLQTLSALYPASDEAQRAQIAGAFYFLGWRSEEAKRLLLGDVHTGNEQLRLRVQWALGRVSDSPEVVRVLLDSMMQDPNPLFRDKAACALANDQIHLSDVQKVRLFAGLIGALDDAKPQVRAIALQALQIHTGQTRGFSPIAPASERTKAIESWRKWLDEYRAQL